jgi:hypothetical protein
MPELITLVEFKSRIAKAQGTKTVHHSTVREAIDRGEVPTVVNSDGKQKIDWHDRKVQEYVKNRKERFNPDKPNARAYSELEKRETELKLRKLEEEAKFKELQRRKLQGEMVPVEMVTKVISTQLKNYTQQFYYASDQMARDLVKQLKGTPEDAARATQYVTDAVNNAADRAKEMTASELKQIIDEFSKL